VLAFIPLTHSVFWGSMAYVLIGGTAVGTVLTLAFLPALYAIWFRVSDVNARQATQSNEAGLVVGVSSWEIAK
jgi:Cu/Ag efflux pump CusA